MYGRDVSRKCSNYKRIHHWHERISQLLLQESQIPDEDMLRIGEKLCESPDNIINKDRVRAVLRSLNMQTYIERWLQIIHRFTDISPPTPGSQLLVQLDKLFIELQRPFSAKKREGRKNFLNYNYVFCRLFQKLGCPQFCMFFPLIKSKSKLRQLDDMWCDMVASIGWEVTPLQHVAPFAVRVERTDLLLLKLKTRCAAKALAETGTEPTRTGFRTWDRRRAEDWRPLLRPPHSSPPAPVFQRLGLLRRRLR